MGPVSQMSADDKRTRMIHDSGWNTPVYVNSFNERAWGLDFSRWVFYTYPSLLLKEPHKWPSTQINFDSSRYGDPDIIRKTHKRISAAISRCHNPKNADYRNYGARGIEVQQSWRENRQWFFLHIVTLKGWDKPGLEMDRINVNKGYEKYNLRFVSKSENMKNRRSVPVMQARILELERRLSKCTCGC